VSDHSVSDWEEIGINSPPPPNLTTFYRYFYTIDPNAPNPNAAAASSKGMVWEHLNTVFTFRIQLSLLSKRKSINLRSEQSKLKRNMHIPKRRSTFSLQIKKHSKRR
jgi:hypothetical protein